MKDLNFDIVTATFQMYLHVYQLVMKISQFPDYNCLAHLTFVIIH